MIYKGASVHSTTNNEIRVKTNRVKLPKRRFDIQTFCILKYDYKRNRKSIFQIKLTKEKSQSE